MSLPTTPPPASGIYAPLRRGKVEGWPVFALQSLLNSVRFAEKMTWPRLETDGFWDDDTEAAVRAYQKFARLVIDGIVGPKTQGMMVWWAEKRVEFVTPELPRGLTRGWVEGEGAGLLAAVNWNVAGGVDCGIVQIRVPGPPYDGPQMALAFNPVRALSWASTQFLAHYEYYTRQSYASALTGPKRREHAMRCSCLAHNWPAAAESFAERGRLLTPDRTAEWVPKGVTFPDGRAVRTWDDWARFYAMGDRESGWAGLIPRYVVSWGG